MENKLSMMLLIISMSAAAVFTLNVQTVNAMPHMKCKNGMCCGSPTGKLEDFACHVID
jgi:hypothetical protein